MVGCFFFNKSRSICNFQLLLVIVDLCWNQCFWNFSKWAFLLVKSTFSRKNSSICLKKSTVSDTFNNLEVPLIYLVYFYTDHFRQTFAIVHRLAAGDDVCCVDFFTRIQLGLSQRNKISTQLIQDMVFYLISLLKMQVHLLKLLRNIKVNSDLILSHLSVLK